MNRSIEEYQELVCTYIRNHGHAHNRDLVGYIMHTLGPSLLENDKYITAIEQLTHQGRITRIIYTPPNSNTGIIYFPGGTDFHFTSGK